MWCPTSSRERKLKVHICKTLTKSLFLEGMGPIEKQNWDGLVGNCVFATVALNWTISGEELCRYKWYHGMISS